MRSVQPAYRTCLCKGTTTRTPLRSNRLGSCSRGHTTLKKTGAPYPFKDEEPGSSEPEIEMHYTEIGIYFSTCPLSENHAGEKPVLREDIEERIVSFEFSAVSAAVSTLSFEAPGPVKSSVYSSTPEPTLFFSLSFSFSLSLHLSKTDDGDQHARERWTGGHS